MEDKMKFKYFEDKNINVRDYIVKNYTPYDGDEEFLTKPTKNTLKLWDELSALMKEERERGGLHQRHRHHRRRGLQAGGYGCCDVQ